MRALSARVDDCETQQAIMSTTLRTALHDSINNTANTLQADMQASATKTDRAQQRLNDRMRDMQIQHQELKNSCTILLKYFQLHHNASSSPHTANDDNSEILTIMNESVSNSNRHNSQQQYPSTATPYARYQGNACIYHTRMRALHCTS